LVVAGLGETLAEALRLNVEDDAVVNQPADSSDGYDTVRKDTFPTGEGLVGESTKKRVQHMPVC